MILSQISYLDCLVFLVLLAPQLILQVGIWKTVAWVLPALPSLASQVFVLPYQFVKERYYTPYTQRSPFVQRATVFQDIVIRCVRYAFAFMPAFLGRVFFSKEVSLPFFRFRMLRHGYLRCPIAYHEVKRSGFRGAWATIDQSQQPDIVVYYCHGGGFSMGSSFFYMEFLLAWVSLLKDAGYRNPALFALEYTLVPDATYPTQLQQTMAGYQYILSIIGDPSRVVVSGDSAGATLMLSFMLYMSDHPDLRSRLPGLAVMISPWVTIVSQNNRNTPSDYLNCDSLHQYGSQYIGSKVSADDLLVSPGNCKDVKRWREASPERGWFFIYGSEEVLGPETRELIGLLKKAGTEIDVHEERGGIHAWPVASLYLGESREERLHGLRDIVKVIHRRIQ